MIFERGLDAITRRTDSVLTVGTFDGVHLGHRKIIHDLVKRTRSIDGTSTLITFDPHPREVLFRQSLPKLTTIEERAAILESLGLDRMIVLPFTEEFSRLSPEDFVTELLVKRTGIRTIIVGHDHRFGQGRRGDVNLLASMGKQYGFDVGVISPYIHGEQAVSSRGIRSILEEGDVAFAAKLMARSHSLTGEVIHGAARGRKLGYPTANVRLTDPGKVVPAHGIYVVMAEVSGERNGGMMSIGVRPAIKNSEGVHLEVHLFDFERTIYGEELVVHFIKRLRGELDFVSMEQLQEAMQKDEIAARKILDALGEVSE